MLNYAAIIEGSATCVRAYGKFCIHSDKRRENYVSFSGECSVWKWMSLG